MELFETIKNKLAGTPANEIQDYLDYLSVIQTEKRKDGDRYVSKNPWFLAKDADFYVRCFKQAQKIGMSIDGKHITVGSNGLSLDYVAYKNKMLMVYPETQFSFREVYEGDTINFAEQSGKIMYNHVIANPFERDPKKIIGVYCIIKNQRGEFLTLLSKDEIAKHRKVAKTSTIWDNWFVEMVYKTVIKKGSKVHFDDIYEKLNEVDNEEIDLDKIDEKEPVTIDELMDFEAKIKASQNLTDLEKVGIAISQAVLKADDKKKLKEIYVEKHKSLKVATI